MLKLYNTLTRKKAIFKPLKDQQVGLYTCGPTVYDYAHIGNFRAYTTADILQRYLKAQGYQVRWVMNITDVDDKTIEGARERHLLLEEYTLKYKRAFIKNLDDLNIQHCNYYPEATKHISEMVLLVKKLLQKGYAYYWEGSVYFDISKFKDYGKFARLGLKGLRPGARVDIDAYNKRSLKDFVLWKKAKKGEPFWETEIGRGRPGWHLECSVMSTKYLGQPFDIHTGGVDLIFPHHQNEIAQSEALGKKLANWWVHNEHLLVNGKKMSKSLGNFYTLEDIIKKNYHPLALRYLYLTAHYRDKLNFTFKALEAAQKAYWSLVDFLRRLYEVTRPGIIDSKIERLVQKSKKAFNKAMDDDLNTPQALAVIFKMIGEVNRIGVDKLSKPSAHLIIEAMRYFSKVLGLGLKRELLREEEVISPEVTHLVLQREKLRREGNFKEADKIRQKLKKQGIFIEDTSQGSRIVVRK